MKTLSFGGGGWMGCFYFGVCQYLVDNNLVNNYRYAVVSVSGCVVSAMLNDTQPRDLNNSIMENEYKRFSQNPFKISRAYMEIVKRTKHKEGFWEKSENFIIGVSSIFFRGKKVSKFNNERHARKLILASAHIPILSGLLPRRVGLGFYLDGILRFNWKNPIKFGDEEIIQVTIKKLEGDHIICPSMNLPSRWCIKPPPPETMDLIFEDGYKQASKYFEKLKENHPPETKCPSQD